MNSTALVSRSSLIEPLTPRLGFDECVSHCAWSEGHVILALVAACGSALYGMHGHGAVKLKSCLGPTERA